MKTFDISTPQGRLDLEGEETLQWALFGELFISRDGELVTVYERAELYP